MGRFEEARGRRRRDVAARVSSVQPPRVSDVPRNPIPGVRFDVEIPRSKFIERTANTGLQRRFCTSIAPEQPDESTRLELPTFYKNSCGAHVPGMRGLAGGNDRTVTTSYPAAALGATDRKRRVRNWFGPWSLARTRAHGITRPRRFPLDGVASIDSGCCEDDVRTGLRGLWGGARTCRSAGLEGRSPSAAGGLAGNPSGSSSGFRSRPPSPIHIKIDR